MMKEEIQTTLEDDFNENDKVGELEFWDYHNTNSVIGYFQEWKPNAYGEHAIIDTSGNGDLLGLPNLTALNSKLKQISSLARGTKVKVVFLGAKVSEKTNRTYLDFDIFAK